MSSGARAKDEGRIRLHRRFPSAFLSTKRDLAVYVPRGYDEGGGRYPVLYMQDGQNLFDPATAFGGQDWRADLTADELIRAGAIRPLIIVGIYNTGAKRVSEYTPTRDRRLRKGGTAGRYAQMLAREIKPLIDHEYRTAKGASHAAVGGSSLGALAALVTALEYPRVFGAAAVISPSVWWDGRAIVANVKSWRGKVHPRVWLDCGTAEGDNPQSVTADLRFLREAMHEKGWRDGVDLAYCEVESAAHNEQAWGARFGRVLEFLFPSHRPAPR